MAREAKGELRPLLDGWEARVTVQGRERIGLELPFTRDQDAEATERCRLLADIARRLRKAGHADDAPKLLEMAAIAAAGPKLEGVLRAVEALCTLGGTVESKQSRTFFKDIGEDWTSGKLHRDWPDHVPHKKSADVDELRLKKLYDVIGHVSVKDFKLEHAEAALRSLPPKKNGEPLSRSSRRQYAQVINRVLGFAVYPLRLIAANPIPKGWLPKPNPRMVFAILRPEEDAKLLSATDDKVPLCYRILFGFMHREGVRREEAVGLRWRDLDLSVDQGVIDLRKHKTQDEVTREPWPLGDGVANALRWWKEEHRTETAPEDFVFVDEYDRPISLDHLAEKVRDFMTAAEIDRPALFDRGKGRGRFGTHSFRRSFVTRSLASGRPEEWVRRRTGHTNTQQLSKYRQAADSLAELDLGEVVPLDLALGIPQEYPTASKRKWRNWQTRWIQVPVG
jgi:integrase